MFFIWRSPISFLILRPTSFSISRWCIWCICSLAQVARKKTRLKSLSDYTAGYSDDCLTTAWQLHEEYLMSAWWLSDIFSYNYHIIFWWLPDDCLMTARRQPDNCLMASWYLPDKSLITALWLPDNCLMNYVGQIRNDVIWFLQNIYIYIYI